MSVRADQTDSAGGAAGEEIVSLADAVGDGLAELEVLRPASTWIRRTARLVNPEAADPGAVRTYRAGPSSLPAEGVATLPDATIFLDRWVRLADGRLLAESLKNPSLPPAQPERPPLPTALETAISILKPGARNYGHVLAEMLPKLLLDRGLLPDCAPILVHRATQAWTTQMLAAAGFDPARAHPLGRRPVRVERLVWPTPVSRPGELSPHVAPALRQLVPAGLDGEATRRLWVGRRCERRRRLVNEEVLERLLEPLGFASVAPDTLSFVQQIELFAQTRVLVGIGGAALTNMVFMPTGGTVISIQPPAMGGTFFEGLASHCGHELVVIWAAPRGGDALRATNVDIEVDPELVLDEVRAVVDG